VLAKLTALLSGKVALTALGVVLVGGAATATTVAATTGHLGPVQTPHIGGASATHTPESNDAQGAHAHTVSIQGTLSSIATCPSGSTSASASITSLTLADAKVSPEHPEQDDATGPKTPGAEATENAASAAKADAAMTAVSGPISVAITKNTRITGADVQELADLCRHLKDRVEAQTTKDANGKYTAWKVTLLGGGQNGGGNNGSGSSQEATLQGAIKSVDQVKSSFTLTTASGDVTVRVSAATAFDGSVHALAQAQIGAHVTVRGSRQADGSVVASKITVAADH
jgi:hypothetical protein